MPTTRTRPGRLITRIWFPPPEEACLAITAPMVVAAAAEAGVPLIRPDPDAAWLADAAGRPTCWHLDGDQLVLTTFLEPEPTPNPGVIPDGLCCSL